MKCEIYNMQVEKLYEEIESLDELTGVVESALDEYNNTHKNQMKLVIFRYVLEHLSRICRIIKQPGGNGLLVGVGGSGRQSLTRLATSMADYQIFQPEISKSYGLVEWKEDLKVSTYLHVCICVGVLHPGCPKHMFTILNMHVHVCEIAIPYRRCC